MGGTTGRTPGRLHKAFYTFAPDGSPRKTVIRTYGEADFDELIRIQSECFPPPFPEELWWNKEQLSNHIRLFPEGALCVEVEGRLAGSMTGLRVRFDPSRPEHTWAEITDEGYIRNHDPEGETLYIVDISVSPEYRKLGLGKWLMQSMYEVTVQLGAKRLLGGGRMSGYHLVADRMTPEAYLTEVLAGREKDPVLTFLLRCGRTPVAVAHGYLEDEESRNNAVLMEWRNPFVPEE
ncbi:GNAT family N-acetyltransferase [Gorillibacterium sp. sgz5001074]|uniref:GNAT family N-acetyltransferase n=1 Tax=Gorillibacterium sp. sgz5001074 TaxID=3446695 RepID=UPI003F667B5C